MGVKKQIECFEVTVNEKTDAFEVEKRIKNCPGIEKVNVVTCLVLRIKFDALKIEGKRVVKLVQQVGRNDRRTRKKNIKSIKQITE